MYWLALFPHGVVEPALGQCQRLSLIWYSESQKVWRLLLSTRPTALQTAHGVKRTLHFWLQQQIEATSSRPFVAASSRPLMAASDALTATASSRYTVAEAISFAIILHGKGDCRIVVPAYGLKYTFPALYLCYTWKKDIVLSYRQGNTEVKATV